jgi:predicted membrane protein
MNNEFKEYNGITIGVTRKRNSSSIVAGLTMIAVGALFLLERRGVIEAEQIVHFWPLVFVVAGISHLVSCRDSWRRGLGWTTFLVAVGVLWTLSNLGYSEFAFHRIWPYFLIGLGIWIMLTRWKHYEGATVANDAQMDNTHVFGGGEYRVTTKNFRGGEINSVFGGFTLDLREADMEGPEAVIEVNAVFGGGEIRVPESWGVVVSGTGIFGGYGDETSQRRAPEGEARAKTLVVKGAAVFGGVVVKN